MRQEMQMKWKGNITLDSIGIKKLIILCTPRHKKLG